MKISKESRILLLVAVGCLLLLSVLPEDRIVYDSYEQNDTELLETLIECETSEVAKLQEIKTNTFQHFRDSIAFKESSDNYLAVNRLGYLGRYQFGRSALQDLGIYRKVTKSEFLNNKELQDNAFESLLQINKFRLRKYAKYIGTEINGILITESGMLAAAHLVGAGSVKKYLRSGGTSIRKDANGTSIEVYLKRFAGYDTTNILSKRKVKIL